jgi:hypothetical protein
MKDDTDPHHRETTESRVEAMGGRFGYAWITLAFFLFSLVGHWLFGWFSFVSQQHQHNEPIEISQYVVQMGRDTLENWQSEFLQLLWQVGGLAWLLYIGSPQSKEGDERKGGEARRHPAQARSRGSRRADRAAGPQVSSHLNPQDEHRGAGGY